MRARWFLAMVSVLVLTVGLTVFVHDRLNDPRGVSQAATSSSNTSGSAKPADEVKVTGTVTAVHVEGAVLDPRTVPTPLTLTSSRGFGNGAELTGVAVGGAISVIVWDGGRPFALASGPGLQLDPAVVDLAADGVRVELGDGAHRILAGKYQLDTPVAVGGASTTPTSKDSVAFAAGPDALLEAKGDTAVVFPHDKGPVHLTGPGVVHLSGTLTVTRGKHSEQARTVDLAAGPFTLILTPITSGWAVQARLQAGVPDDLSIKG